MMVRILSFTSQSLVRVTKLRVQSFFSSAKKFPFVNIIRKEKTYLGRNIKLAILIDVECF